MNGVLGHDSALADYNGPVTTWGIFAIMKWNLINQIDKYCSVLVYYYCIFSAAILFYLHMHFSAFSCQYGNKNMSLLHSTGTINERDMLLFLLLSYLDFVAWNEIVCGILLHICQVYVVFADFVLSGETSVAEQMNGWVDE